jgi:hypothetical protein
LENDALSRDPCGLVRCPSQSAEAQIQFWF